MTRLTRADLEAVLRDVPRVRLAALPTPLEPAPRLSAELGGPEIWIKRDDLTGLCFGGNKTRQLEFVFADLLRQGLRHRRRRRLHPVELVPADDRGRRQARPRHLAGPAARREGAGAAGQLPALQADGRVVTVVDLPSLELLQPQLEAKADELRAAGRQPYLVAPMGTATCRWVRSATSRRRSSWIGGLGGASTRGCLDDDDLRSADLVIGEGRGASMSLPRRNVPFLLARSSAPHVALRPRSERDGARLSWRGC